MIKFFLSTDNSKKDGKENLAYIFPNICYRDQEKYTS